MPRQKYTGGRKPFSFLTSSLCPNFIHIFPYLLLPGSNLHHLSSGSLGYFLNWFLHCFCFSYRASKLISAIQKSDNITLLHYLKIFLNSPAHFKWNTNFLSWLAWWLFNSTPTSYCRLTHSVTHTGLLSPSSQFTLHQGLRTACSSCLDVFHLSTPRVAPSSYSDLNSLILFRSTCHDHLMDKCDTRSPSIMSPRPSIYHRKMCLVSLH